MAVPHLLNWKVLYVFFDSHLLSHIGSTEYLFIDLFQATITLSDLCSVKILSNTILLIAYLLTVAMCTHALVSYLYSFNSLKAIVKIMYSCLGAAV